MLHHSKVMTQRETQQGASMTNFFTVDASPLESHDTA